jgi:sugar-specific transcriptional regulator TrmB
MPSSTNVLDEARRLVETRLDDLNSERDRLERVIVELNGGAPKAARRPRAKATATAAPAKRARRKGGKTRADQAVKLIEKKPGISASDIAKTMKIKPNYLYRVLGDLEKEGRVTKDGRNYSPAK